MPGPARAGLFVYACDKDRVASFYQAVAGMVLLHRTEEIAVLESEDMQLIIHQIPAHIAADIRIESPPRRREDTALKLFFTVSSLQVARDVAALQGGEVFTENRQGPGFVACNAMDPEGNVFQVRQSPA